MRYFLGGTSVLIVVGVALELVDKLQAQLVMKAYDGGAAPSGPSGGGSGKRKGQARGNASWTKRDGAAEGGAEELGEGTARHQQAHGLRLHTRMCVCVCVCVCCLFSRGRRKCGRWK